MKEYCIYIKQGSGMPYVLKTYPDIFSAKRAVETIVDYEEERHKMYFVDNDYFFNKYHYIGDGLKYICIKVREVTEWQKHTETENKLPKTNNIIYLKKY